GHPVRTTWRLTSLLRQIYVGPRGPVMRLERSSGQFFDALFGDFAGRSRRYLCAISLPVLLVIIPLAYARPGDPTWISGFYDEADYDDVVALVTEGTGIGIPERPVQAAGGLAMCVWVFQSAQVRSRSQHAEVCRGPPPIELGPKILLHYSEPPQQLKL